MSVSTDESAAAAQAIISNYIECSESVQCQEVESTQTVVNDNDGTNFTAEEGNSASVIVELSEGDQEMVAVDGTEASIVIDTGGQDILTQTSVIIDDHKEICEVVQVEEAEMLPGSAPLKLVPQEGFLETVTVPTNSTQTVLQVMDPPQQFRPVDLSDIMEVFTQYRCKFCSHVCSDTSTMRRHVEETHVSNVQRISQDHVAVLEQQPLPGEPLTVTPQHEYSSLSMASQQIEGEAITVTSCDVGVGDDQHIFQTAEESDSHEGMMEAEPGLLQVDEHIDTEVTRTNGQAIATVALQISDHADKTIEGATFLQVEEKEEVFLCGHCNEGFQSIDFCRMHMLHAHNIAAAVVENQETEAAMLIPNRVSVATQAVTRKKPGRKRKEEKTEEALKTEEEDDVKNNPEEIEVFETIGKRKVRPPRHLADLYVVSKRRHIGPSRVRTEPFKLNCPKTGCMAYFRTQEALDLHLTCHVSKRTKGIPPFCCPFCPETFSQWRITRSHLWQKHKKDTDMIVCDICDYRCAGAAQLEFHMALHNSERPFICSICGKGFINKLQERNHKALHDMDPEQKGMYSEDKKDCNICKREFINSKCLKTHMLNVHGKEKHFQCQYCGYGTTRKAMMDLHVRSHTGEKPYACDKCSYVTGDHNSLRRHKMRHTGEKPYRCKHCNYSCIQTISLKSHLRSKHPNSDALFDCKLCQYHTVSELSWKNHLLDHENGRVTIPLVPTLQKEKRELRSIASEAASAKAASDQADEPAAVQAGTEKNTPSNGQIVYQYNNVLTSFDQHNMVLQGGQPGVGLPVGGGQTSLVVPTAPAPQQGVVIPTSGESIVVDGIRQQTVTLQLPGQTRPTQVLLLQPTESGHSGTAVVYNVETEVPMLMAGQGQGQFGEVISGSSPGEVSTITIQEVQVSTEEAEQVAAVVPSVVS